MNLMKDMINLNRTFRTMTLFFIFNFFGAQTMLGQSSSQLAYECLHSAGNGRIIVNRCDFPLRLVSLRMRDGQSGQVFVIDANDIASALRSGYSDPLTQKRLRGVEFNYSLVRNDSMLVVPPRFEGSVTISRSSGLVAVIAAERLY